MNARPAKEVGIKASHTSPFRCWWITIVWMYVVAAQMEVSIELNSTPRSVNSDSNISTHSFQSG